MSLKMLIKSFDRRFLSGILALIFLLTLALSDVTLSQEAQGRQQKQSLKAGSSQDVILIKDTNFRSNFKQLSAWLSQNRRNILVICLPALAVLVFISKLQGRRKWPGGSVYTDYVPASTSFIGSKLNGNSRAVKNSKNRRSDSAAGNPKRKSFEQSTEHWKEKHAGHTPVAGKSFQISEKWPQRKDKFEDSDRVIAKAGQKQCRKCEEPKDHSDFHKDKSCKDGLASWCKECKKQYRQKRTAEKK